MGHIVDEFKHDVAVWGSVFTLLQVVGLRVSLLLEIYVLLMNKQFL